MNPVFPDALARPRFIDAGRLTLPLKLLDYVATQIPHCSGILEDNDPTLEITLALMKMALDELRRLQDQALVEGQP